MVQAPDTEPEGTRRPLRPRLLPLAAAALIMIGGTSLVPIPDSRLEEGTSDPATLDSHLELLLPSKPLTPEEVAESFMAAWIAGDSQAAASLFRPGTKFHGFEPGEFPALHRWYQATGWEFLLSECGPHSFAGAGCDYFYENKLTRAVGLGPLAGSFRPYIEGGQIWLVNDRFKFEDGWSDFRDWLLTYHSDDFERMYEQHSRSSRFVFRYVLADQRAVELWEQYTDEFVALADRSRQDHIARISATCLLAHDRLNKELRAAGIELVDPPGMNDPLYLVPKSEEDLLSYEKAARRIMGETLLELRAIPPPEPPRGVFDFLYELMEQFAEGVEDPNTATTTFWIHQVELEPSLIHCTFALGR